MAEAEAVQVLVPLLLAVLAGIQVLAVQRMAAGFTAAQVAEVVPVLAAVVLASLD